MGPEPRLKTRDIYDATHLMRRYQCGLTREKCATLGRICDTLFEREEQWTTLFDQDEVLSADLFGTLREAFAKTTSWRKRAMDLGEEFKPVEDGSARSMVRVGGTHSAPGGQPTDLRRGDDRNGERAGASNSNADRGGSGRNRPGTGTHRSDRTRNGTSESPDRRIEGSPHLNERRGAGDKPTTLRLERTRRPYPPERGDNPFIVVRLLERKLYPPHMRG